VSGIALENGINANVLFRWRREHLRAVPRVQDPGAAQAVLLPVEVAAPPPPAKQEAVSTCSPVPEGVIEIDIGGARVRLRGSVDEANVRCVLHTLRTLA
jgi:transposase